MQILQNKFDELERQGVFARPEEVGVVVEHVSPSFLVRKANGGFRLVTAFTTIGEYSKTLPSIMPTVDDTLRMIASWKYIIATDLRDAFYQIPLDKTSMKWCATSTPYRGLRVYLVSAQGMPGSSETLEEMMCTVLGSLIQEGCVAKIADDLYVGGDSLNSLYENWSRVLNALRLNGLTLKSNKTVIAPTHLQILGWNWNNGTISACPHRISPLATCQPPKTVTAQRSFIGSYKVFNRVIRGCSGYLQDLESAIAGKGKSDKIMWSDSLLQSFKHAHTALSSSHNIFLPQSTDQLITVHDGSQQGIGSVLYILQNRLIKLGGFFSVKLKSHQALWYPCELEALSLATSVKHFGPYIRQSMYRTQVLTDNKPCVQTWSKLVRGEFSTSARVATFMSTLSEYPVDVQHISGVDNLPSDFHSRNPPQCESPSCQICKFIADSDQIVVQLVTADQVLSGVQPVPFYNRPALKAIQMECPDLRRVHSHLLQGTRPTTKKKRLTNVKRYLQKATIGRDGLLIVRHSEPFKPEFDLPIIPNHILPGLLTALHLRLNHPTAYQLKQVFQRYYFALNANNHIDSVVQSCSQCQALKAVPRELHEQSTSELSSTPGVKLAADVMRRCKQHVLILRDTLSSYTATSLLSDERHQTLRNAIISAVSLLRPSPQASVTVRVDNAPSLQALHNDLQLVQLNIQLEYGRVHNINKNPVAEKAINELHNEIVRQQPEGGPISAETLANITSQLNARLRVCGLSSWEIYHRRDQFSGAQINFPDDLLSREKQLVRESNHDPSAKCKARGGPPAVPATISVGSLVYIKSEHDKSHARDRYIVVSVDNKTCTVEKLVKSQLRSKRYILKLTEVYPVVPTVIESSPIADSATSSDSEFEEDPFNLLQGQNSQDEQTGSQASISTPVPVAPPSRRPTRSRRKPRWMTSGDYIIDYDSEEADGEG